MGLWASKEGACSQDLHLVRLLRGATWGFVGGEDSRARQGIAG